MCLHLHVKFIHMSGGDVVRVNQEVNHVSKLHMALGRVRSNTIHDRSKGQRHQLHTSRRERERVHSKYHVCVWVYYILQTAEVKKRHVWLQNVYMPIIWLLQ